MVSLPHWLACDDVAVAVLPKVASQSIGEYSRERLTQLTAREVFDIPRRVAWVRDPMDRLQSAYTFFREMTKNGPCGRDGFITKAHTKDWSTFVDLTLETPDAHWHPQVELLTFGDRFIPTEVHRFENIQKTWPWYGLLPWFNGTKHYPVDTTYRQAELTEKYREDMQLWLSLEQ